MITRTIEQRICNHLFKGKAIVVVGARQTGKSTLFKQILSLYPDVATLELDCDEPEIREALTNLNLNQLKLLVGNNKIVVIDEAQRVTNIGLTLKLIHDKMPDVQLLVTGSSALSLTDTINEPLTGRIYEYKLFPISSAELYEYKGFLFIRQSMEARLIYGSYPDIVTHQDEAKELLATLANSYLYKDLLSYEGIRRPQLLEKLLVALALQIGSEISYNELAQTIGTDSKTIEKYIDLLEQCYIVFHLNAFNRNVRTELKKGKKIYFYDNGIRNAILGNYAPLSLRQDTGALWENFVISERIKHNHYTANYAQSYFWRTTAQQEIDYIELQDGRMKAFEIKWNPRKGNARLPKTFSDAYDVQSFDVITRDNYMDILL